MLHRRSLSEDLWRDSAFGLRMLLRKPGFAAVVVLTLALGVGANTAIFSVVHAVLLRPLPYRDPDRIVTLLHGGWYAVAPANFLDWRAQTRMFERVAAAQLWGYTLTGRDKPEQLRSLEVTADMFALLYLPDQQKPPRSLTLAIRCKTDPSSLAEAVRSEVWALDKDIPVSKMLTMQDAIANAVAEPHFNMLLLNVFAAVALVLAAVGVYGVMAYSVAQRTREIGIRLAFGAQTGEVLRLVVGQGMSLAATGVAIGLLASWGLTRLMTGLLFGVSATDPLTFAVISATLTGVALAACWLPALRATKVDPIDALRYE